MALIPVGFGAGFLALSPGVKTYNKAVAHIVALLALVTLATLFAPLTMVASQGDSLKVDLSKQNRLRSPSPSQFPS